MGQLYTSQKSKLNGNINAMNYFTNMLQEADKRVKRNTVNEPLFYKDAKSTKNLRRSILADRKLFPAKSTKAEKDRIVAKHLRAYKEVFSQNGEPGINIGENIIARTHYNEPDNTIELARASSKKLLEELSHAKQNKEGKSVWLSTAADWIANPYFTNKGQRKMYNRPGTTEYEAHKEIEPQLRKDYKDILERNEDYEKYRNYVDNSESDYKFEMGGSMYKTIPEYEKARSIYEAEKGKAGTYNDFQTELYTQAGRTRGTSETPRQLGDMFNTLSPAQQDAMAAKYKAEFIPSTTPSSTRRNYINSMEMNVPGKGTGYYSFPTNDVVYGTKVIERPMLQMDRIQVPQAKPVQQLSAGYKPSMNQRITMPGMKMPATQSTQNMTQPSKTYTSVVDLLNSRKMDSSFSARKKMAEKMGITNYTGSSMQNKELNSRLMNEQFGNGGNLTMYGPGGQLPPKEYNNLKDFQKAEKLYTDSLTTYNNSIIRRAEIIQNYKNAKNIRELEEANNRTKAKYPVNQNIQIKDKSEILVKRKLPDGTTAQLVSDKHFKKPVQPVVYRPPAKQAQKLNEKIMKPFYSYGVKPTTSLEKLKIAAPTLDNPKVTPRGELLPITPMTLPQQGNTPFYGPGGTTVGYTNEKMEFYPAQKYTGATNNPLNLQDKELLDNPEMLKKYALSKDNYKFSYGGKLSSKYLKMLAYGGVITDDLMYNEENQFERPVEPELNYMQAAQYALPKSVVNMKGEPINLPKGTATVDLGNVKADNTTPDNSNLEDMSAVGSIGTQLGAALIGSKAQKKNNPNSTYTYDGQNRTTEGAKGIATGFALGNKIVPGVGGAVGAFAGGIYGIAKGSKMDKQAKLDRGYQDKMFKRSRDLEMEGRQRLQGEQQYGSNTQMYGNGGKIKPESEPTPPRTLVGTLTNFIPGYETYVDYKDIVTGAINGDRAQMNQGVLGLSSPLAGKAFTNGLDYITEKVLGKEVADELASRRTNIVNMSNSERKTLYERYGIGGYEKWKAAGSPDLNAPLPIKKPDPFGSKNKKDHAYGGNLSSKFLAGLNPAISQTSSSTTEINGKSHEDGGVPIRNMNAEVEKGETTSGDYVFSKRLGFAKIHKPIAKAKGMIEEKPMTASRINSLKLLAEKEQKLSMAQEYIKNTLNLQ